MEFPNPPDPRSPIHHRAPILCVDRILEASEEHSLCEFEVRAGPHVNDGLFWEMGLVEGMAQSAAVLQAHPSRAARHGDETSAAEGVGMLVGIRKFEVLRQARVGEWVTWRISLIKRLGPYLLADGTASCAGELIARGELKFYWEMNS